jgi:CDGSH-type Zn-finger protein
MHATDGMTITVTANGPYLVAGSVPITREIIVADNDGNSVGWGRGDRFETRPTCALCRCGKSAAKPFCDGTHATIEFDGTETAEREPYLTRATEQEGPTLALTDVPALCALARFCDVAGQVWNLVQQEGPEAAELTIREAGMCPSGRLVAWDLSTQAAIEPELEASIGIVDDPEQSVAGPIWVRGGIAVIDADGQRYEVRNRVTLCRCGASRNKPFCDASHAAIDFTE